MLASKTCSGSATSVRATQATFQMLNWPSASVASVRPRCPEARGQRPGHEDRERQAGQRNDEELARARDGAGRVLHVELLVIVAPVTSSRLVALLAAAWTALAAYVSFGAIAFTGARLGARLGVLARARRHCTSRVARARGARGRRSSSRLGWTGRGRAGRVCGLARWSSFSFRGCRSRCRPSFSSGPARSRHWSGSRSLIALFARGRARLASDALRSGEVARAPAGRRSHSSIFSAGRVSRVAGDSRRRRAALPRHHAEPPLRRRHARSRTTTSAATIAPTGAATCRRTSSAAGAMARCTRSTRPAFRRWSCPRSPSGAITASSSS